MPQPDGKGMSRSAGEALFSPSVKGLFNAKAGLAGWQQARSTARVPGGGGIDVVLAGDSELESFQCWTNSATYRTNKLSIELTRNLQSDLNPDNVLGGYGFLPIYTGDSVPTPVFSLDGVENAPNPNGQGVGTRNQTLVPGANRYYINIDGGSGSAAAQNDRRLVTHFELVGRKGTAVGAYRYDAAVTALPAIGAGTVTGSTASGSPNTYGFHFGPVSIGALSGNNSNFYTIGAPSAGSNVNPDGIIFYNGDISTGVRVHDVTNTGTAANAYAAAANQINALLQWFQTPDTDTTTAGASRGKLLIINFGMNDLDPTGISATYMADLRTIITAIKDPAQCPSRPDVLFWSEFPRGGANGATQEALYREYLPQIKALAVELNFAVFDYWAYYLSVTRATANSLYNISQADNIHYLLKEQFNRAGLMRDILTRYPY